MEIGSLVVATMKFVELGFKRAGRTHVHARPGDLGRVVDVFADGGFMVRWERSGTACDADVSEIR